MPHQPSPRALLTACPSAPQRAALIRRLVDMALAGAMAWLALPLVLGAVMAIWALDGRPVLHRSTRVGRNGVHFTLWKLRTLRPDPSGPDRASGGHLTARQTRTGPFLRRTRIDELPQLWNVLRGEMALVGVRPPLPAHVALQPAAYADLLRAPPGLTGLATLRLHGIEGRRLATARTAEETEAIYARRILPLKLRIDRIHARRRSVALDLWILARTFGAVARLVVARTHAGHGERQPGDPGSHPWPGRVRIDTPRGCPATHVGVPLSAKDVASAACRVPLQEASHPAWTVATVRPSVAGHMAAGR